MMPRGPYKQYEHDPCCPVPKSTVHSRKTKRKRCDNDESRQQNSSNDNRNVNVNADETHDDINVGRVCIIIVCLSLYVILY